MNQHVNYHQKPSTDPLLVEIIGLMHRDGRSRTAQANISGLAPATILRWEKGLTRRPQAVSIAAVARALGYQLAIVKAK